MTINPKFTALIEYVFKEDLMNDPVTVHTVAHTHNGEPLFVNMVESLPVHTFRGGMFKREVVKAHKTKEDALKAHIEIVKGGVKHG